MAADWIEKASRHRFGRIRGRKMTEWLLDLVGDDLEKQLECAKMLDRLRSVHPPPPEGDEPVDIERHWARIDAAVRTALKRRTFPRREFVRQLVKNYEATLRHRQKQAVWMMDGKTKLIGKDRMGLFMAYGWVFGALGEELLDAENLLRRQINGRLSGDVGKALQRMGPAGRVFLPQALRRLDAGNIKWNPWTPALAAIVGDDVEAIAQVVERLGASDYEPPPPWRPGMPGRAPSQAHNRIFGTLQTLSLVGAPARPVPGVLEKIEALVDYFAPEAVEALGAVGADDLAVLEKLEGYTRATEWNQQAGAILGLAHFPAHAERVVPRLADLLYSFEEQDGDWMYAGDHERVLKSLGAYGEKALPALETLDELGYFDIKKHWDHEEQRSFFVFLGDLGTAASERALEKLEELVATRYRGDEQELAEDLPDARRDYISMLWALRRLRGEI